MAESESPGAVLFEMSQVLSDKAKSLEAKKRRGKGKARKPLLASSSSSSSSDEGKSTLGGRKYANKGSEEKWL